MTDPAANDWLRDEPGFMQARLEIQRMFRRARRRPLAVLLVALAVVAFVVYKRHKRPAQVKTTITFRVTEGEKVSEESAPPPPARELKEYVWSVALSATRVTEVMKKHHISTAMLDSNPVMAITSFREDIGLYVWRNYFLVDEGRAAERSARLAVSYSGPDKAEVRAVALDLAQLIVDEEERRRTDAVEAALAGVREAVTIARADLDERHHQLAVMDEELARATPERAIILRVERDDLQKSLRSSTDRLMSAQKDETDLELQLSFETMGASLRFEKVSEETEIVAREATPGGLVVLGFAVLLLCLPLAAMLVGALDPRVYDLDDVRRLGVPAVGHVPPFRGDAVASLNARTGRP
jgi:hypothetical protein